MRIDLPTDQRTLPPDPSPDTVSDRLRRLRDIRDLAARLLEQLDRLERESPPLSPQLILAQRGLRGLPDDLDACADRLEHPSDEPLDLHDTALSSYQREDWHRLTGDLLDFATWLDHMEYVNAARGGMS